MFVFDYNYKRGDFKKKGVCFKQLKQDQNKKSVLKMDIIGLSYFKEMCKKFELVSCYEGYELNNIESMSF